MSGWSGDGDNDVGMAGYQLIGELCNAPFIAFGVMILDCKVSTGNQAKLREARLEIWHDVFSALCIPVQYGNTAVPLDCLRRYRTEPRDCSTSKEGEKFATPHLENGGRVLAVSGWDSFRALPGHGLLGAAKAAMETLVKYLAVELGPQGITAVGICPGPIDTDSFRFYAGEHWDEYERNWLALTPSGKYPTPDDVAEAMAFLCSRRSAAINGQTIVLDGGLSLATMPRTFGY